MKKKIVKRLLFVCQWGVSTASDMNKWIDGGKMYTNTHSTAEHKAFMH